MSGVRGGEGGGGSDGRGCRRDRGMGARCECGSGVCQHGGVIGAWCWYDRRIELRPTGSARTDLNVHSQFYRFTVQLQ